MSHNVSKFRPLEFFLESQHKQIIRLTFEEIEKIIGMPLCESAYKYTAYWHPSKTHVLPNMIIGTGYIIESVDLQKKIITLRLARQ